VASRSGPWPASGGCAAGVDIARFLDAAAPALLVAQSIGRVGNWFNRLRLNFFLASALTAAGATWFVRTRR